MTRDYYAVLGVATAASAAQIRRAYQRLARQYSPDVNFWERDARALFEEIAEAYRVLSDPMARAVYDREPPAPSAKPRGTRGAPRPSGRRGDDLHMPVELAFQQAVSGVAADVPADRLSPCAECGATGAAPGSARGRAAIAAGSARSGASRARPVRKACPACDGSGARALDPCPGLPRPWREDRARGRCRDAPARDGHGRPDPRGGRGPLPDRSAAPAAI